jgi:hypothetical protein
MEFKIENTMVFGLDRCVVSSGNSYRTELRTADDLNDKDLVRADKLGSVQVGSGHDSFLNGITVIADFTAPLYWWKQAQRYHWFEFVSSQSTMHCVAKFKLVDRCTKDVDQRILDIIQSMIDDYNAQEVAIKSQTNGTLSLEALKIKHKELWYKIIASLPCGFCLSATMTTNYRQIKTMCLQRKYHPLNEWHDFIKWACSLPNFSKMTGITE